MDTLQIVMLSLVLLSVFTLIFLQIKNNNTINISQIKKEFEHSQKIQNMDLLQAISKDSGELKQEFIREIGNFKTDLTNRVTEENKNLTVATTKAIADNNEKLNKDIHDFQQSLNAQIQKDFKELNVEIDKNFKEINDRVELRLSKSFKDTNQTFQNVLERITKIDAAQKKIEELSTNIVDLQGVLTDKKTRGIFGEVQLKQLLVNVFGEGSDLYGLQKLLSNGKLVDAVIYAPEPINMIPIDSKFPLENYNRMVDSKLADTDRDAARKQFKLDVKNHINAISEKYIIPNETSEQAFMFLPAEAIFAEINAYHSDLVDYGYQKHITIASPSTLVAMTTVIQAIVRENEIHKNAKRMQEELNKLGSEFDRFKSRWDSLDRTIDKLTKDAKNINITSNKISSKFESIAKVQLPEELEVEKPLIDTL